MTRPGSLTAHGHGVWSLRIPLPLGTPPYLLAYVIESRDEFVLIDLGWDTDEGWSALVGGLGELGIGPADVRGVLVTHAHADHFGLAERFRAASDAWLAMHPAEAAMAAARWRPGPETALAQADLLLRVGFSAADVETLAALEKERFGRSRPPRADRLLTDGQRTPIPGRRIDTLWTPGHSPGHLCFVDTDHDLLFSGDHLLPRLYPNVGMGLHQSPNPLADFFASIERVRLEHSSARVLPAHDDPFDGVAERAERIKAHHRRRTEAVRRALADQPGTSCVELAEVWPWSRPWSAMPMSRRRLAVNELLAQLVLLGSTGCAVRSGTRPERWWPTPAGAAPRCP